MARSALTLAASIAAALPRAGVVRVSALTEGLAGRFDTAAADLDDGRRVVIRFPEDAAASRELAEESRALRALTPGVRALVPFRIPEEQGSIDLDDARLVVMDFLPGYRIDATHLPAGEGAATSLGRALAALHALPTAVVRAEGLPARTPEQVRSEARAVIDRAAATGRVPEALERRWRRALETEPLWRFESTVVLGAAEAGSFLFEDLTGVPTVTGVLGWHGLSVGDPARDLQWLAAAPLAAESVYEAYAAASVRAPDALLRERARLYAELEFASWLVHGADTGRADVVEDAVALLTSLADGIGTDDVAPAAAPDLDHAIALLDRVPDAPAAAVDTSMQTDAYDPEMLSAYLAAERAGHDAGPEEQDEADAEALRATEAALRRWTGTNDA
ncbi:phosphotransferase [Microbacterium sp. X-17]|uniref:phosphotransferase n=1 Tax=Microbacterium sp. X-17 TaxID=3144404 RepID=UPI0031F5BE78